MYTLPHVSKKGFTLIEMMIVIGIIGILTSALYPQINQYLERAKIVKYQAFAKDTIQVVKNYTTEIGAPEAGDLAFTVTTDWDLCPISCINRHPGLSDYIAKNSPQLYLKKDELSLPGFSTLYTSYSNLYLPEYSGYGFSFPGKDMSSIQKIPAFIWSVPGGWEAPEGTDIYLSGSNIPASADKRCSPGIAFIIFNEVGTEWVLTSCIYFMN